MPHTIKKGARCELLWVVSYPQELTASSFSSFSEDVSALGSDLLLQLEKSTSPVQDDTNAHTHTYAQKKKACCELLWVVSYSQELTTGSFSSFSEDVSTSGIKVNKPCAGCHTYTQKKKSPL
jgi:hypothetical protein